MNLTSVSSRWIASALLGLALVGCDFIGGNGVTDELKEAHFQNGKIRLQALDYPGAAESFKKAIEVNPQSSSAHFELGLLYANKLSENLTNEDERDRHFATAIYHFENYLHLSPNPVLADRARQQIIACKLELARTVSFTLLSTTIQTELERLHRTNATQHAQIEQLRVELAQQAFAHSNRMASLQTEYATALNARAAAAQGNSPSNGDPVPSPRQIPSTPTAPPGTAGGIARQAGQATKPSSQQNSRPASPSTPSPRTYKVQTGDTPAGIARKHGVSLPALQAANPGLEPRHLRVGQSVTIPGQRN